MPTSRSAVSDCVEKAWRYPSARLFLFDGDSRDAIRRQTVAAALEVDGLLG